ncbi:MAG: putative hydro-lyase [Rhodospirillales bacterium]|nr:putative hydro-lyase [Rhodospirillales bacterium]
MGVSDLSLLRETEELRAQIRAGQITGPTAGMAAGRMQANLVVLPEDFADAFHDFCLSNPQPCPLLAITELGQSTVPALGATIDLRSDLPRYRVWRDGAIVDEPSDVTSIWRENLVAFVLGCSFGFETAMMEAGIKLHHVTAGRNVPMYDTKIPLQSTGPFGGTMVVSMRQIPTDRVEDAIRISGQFPQCHGKPVHVGEPSDIGVASIEHPDYGDPPVGDGVPMFWACGVTPQTALRRARPPFAITHDPGRMLICDIPATWDQVLNPAT